MIAITRFFPQVSGRLPNCPDPILADGVLAACDEFARQTRLIVDTINVRAKAGTPYVEVESYEGHLFMVDKLWRGDDEHLTESSRYQFELERLDEISGTPSDYYLDGDGRIVLGPIPVAAEVLRAKVPYAPALDATEVKDSFFTDWSKEISAGARAYIRRTFTTWANPNEEAIDSAIFERGVGEAISQRAKGRTSKRRIRVKGCYF